jgi:hypothetical protein
MKLIEAVALVSISIRSRPMYVEVYRRESVKLDRRASQALQEMASMCPL